MPRLLSQTSIHRIRVNIMSKSINIFQRFHSICVLALALILSACGGGGGTSWYSVSGTITGLGVSETLSLSLNNGPVIVVSAANGSFKFTNNVQDGTAWSVAMGAAPTDRTCTLANGTSTAIHGNVTNVAIACSLQTETISGTVTGLPNGASLVLNNNSTDLLTLTGAGSSSSMSFTFAKPIASGGTFTVGVTQSPAGYTCNVSNASGTVVIANVGSVSVTCSQLAFTVGGTVTGLSTITGGQPLVLKNNGSDTLTLTGTSASLPFTFNNSVAYGAGYLVTIATQPTGQSCVVNNATAQAITQAVNSISISCSTTSFSFSGLVTGLLSGKQLVLQNNFSDSMTILNNSSFNGTFSSTSSSSNPKPIPYNGSYSLTVATQPSSETCTIINGAASGITANVTNIQVQCNQWVWTVSTVANATSILPLTGINSPQGLVMGADGNIYFVDNASSKLWQYNPSTNLVTPIAGSGTSGFVNGVASVAPTNATFNSPFGITVDAKGNLYITDSGNSVIREMSPSTATPPVWTATTFSGSGVQGTFDGVATVAQFNLPTSVAAEPSGKYLYVADSVNNTIRKITLSGGAVVTLAGSGVAGSADGTGIAATFNKPSGIAVDPQGNIYVADKLNSSIRKITPTGVVTTLAGNGTVGSLDGQGKAASFNHPTTLVVDPSFNVFVADTGNNAIRMISQTGNVSTIAGNLTAGYYNAIGTAASFNQPSGLALDASGNLYVADTNNGAIRLIAKTYTN